MAKATVELRNEVFVCNTVFTGSKGQPQSVAARLRCTDEERSQGCNGKTAKFPVWMFGNALPMPGEAIYVSSASVEDDDTSNYRIVRNGKVSIASETDAAPTAPPF